MSFRRKGKVIHEQRRRWEAWRRKYDRAIRRSGLPEAVLADEDHWLDFLEHGFIDHHEDPTGWTVDQLSLEQRRELRRFLDEVLSPNEKASAFVFRSLDDSD